MKGPSPFSADQYAPLLCLWGIKSLKRKGGFCIKIQTMVHKTLFFFPPLTLLLYAFILSLLHFPFNFPLLERAGGGGGVRLFNGAGNLDFQRFSRRLQEANNRSYTHNMSLWWLICMDSLTGSQILFTVNTRQTSAVCRDKQTYGFSDIA